MIRIKYKNVEYSMPSGESANIDIDMHKKIISQLQAENKGLKLFIACKHKGTFAGCNPDSCIQCHIEAKGE